MKRQFCERAYFRACSFPMSGFLSSDLASRTMSGKPLVSKQQEVYEALMGFLKILSESVEILSLECHTGFKLNVGRDLTVREETPTSCFEQYIDFDAGGGFFSCYSYFRFFGWDWWLVEGSTAHSYLNPQYLSANP